MSGAVTVAAIGFLSAFTGTIIGFCAAQTSKRMGGSFEGALSGFTAGLLIAFICFKMLEEGFAAAPFYVGAAGLLSGAVSAIIIDWLISCNLAGSKDVNAAAVAAAGIMLHHFPEGLALGGMSALSARQGLALAAIISAHCVPEAMAVFMPLGKKARGVLRPIAIAAALSLPVAAGSIAGVFLKEASGMLPAFFLTFSSGVMLYITCGEMLPGTSERWGMRITAVFSAAGFILGVVITA